MGPPPTRASLCRPNPPSHTAPWSLCAVSRVLLPCLCGSLARLWERVPRFPAVPGQECAGAHGLAYAREEGVKVPSPSLPPSRERTWSTPQSRVLRQSSLPRGAQLAPHRRCFPLPPPPQLFPLFARHDPPPPAFPIFTLFSSPTCCCFWRRSRRNTLESLFTVYFFLPGLRPWPSPPSRLSRAVDPVSPAREGFAAAHGRRGTRTRVEGGRGSGSHLGAPHTQHAQTHTTHNTLMHTHAPKSGNSRDLAWKAERV